MHICNYENYFGVVQAAVTSLRQSSMRGNLRRAGTAFCRHGDAVTACGDVFTSGETALRKKLPQPFSGEGNPTMFGMILSDSPWWKMTELVSDINVKVTINKYEGQLD